MEDFLKLDTVSQIHGLVIEKSWWAKGDATSLLVECSPTLMVVELRSYVGGEEQPVIRLLPEEFLAILAYMVEQEMMEGTEWDWRSDGSTESAS